MTYEKDTADRFPKSADLGAAAFTFFLGDSDTISLKVAINHRQKTKNRSRIHARAVIICGGSGNGALRPNAEDVINKTLAYKHDARGHALGTSGSGS